MRFYKVSLSSTRDSSLGFEFYRTARRATDAKNANDNEDVTCTIEAIDVTPTKAGILAALREHGSHPDNG